MRRGIYTCTVLLLSAALLNVQGLDQVLNCPLPTLADVTSLVHELNDGVNVVSYNFSCLAYGDIINSYQSVGFIAQDTNFSFYYITAQCTTIDGYMIWCISDGTDTIQAPFTGQPQENCYSCVLLPDVNETTCLGKHVSLKTLHFTLNS